MDLDLSKLDDEQRAQLEQLMRELAEGELSTQPRRIDPDELDPEKLGAPRAWWPAIRFLRTAPFRDRPGVLGAGLGLREQGGEETSEICVVVLVRHKRPRSKLEAAHCLPEFVEHDGARIRIDVQEGPDLLPQFAATALPNVIRTTQNRSGGSISQLGDPDPCPSGTLTGVFDGDCLTCAHVALGFGFRAFMDNLPASLLWLFQSPGGQEMVASSGMQVGQSLYRLFEVDTSWPILVPLPIPLGASVGLLYVDGAAGRQAPQTIGTIPAPFAPGLPNLAPDRATRFGATIGGARIAIPGEDIYKDGQTTGLTFGRVWMPFFQLYLPIPIPPFGAVVIFDLVLCRLTIAPGDSGAAVLTDDDDLNYLCQVSLGLPPLGSAPPATAGNCVIDQSVLLDFTIGTPFYLHQLLLGVDLT